MMITQPSYSHMHITPLVAALGNNNDGDTYALIIKIVPEVWSCNEFVETRDFGIS